MILDDGRIRIAGRFARWHLFGDVAIQQGPECYRDGRSIRSSVIEMRNHGADGPANISFGWVEVATEGLCLLLPLPLFSNGIPVLPDKTLGTCSLPNASLLIAPSCDLHRVLACELKDKDILIMVIVVGFATAKMWISL